MWKIWFSIKLSQKTGNHKKEVFLVKLLDNLPFSKALSIIAIFFLMFSKLSLLMFGWFIQPFHIKDSLYPNISIVYRNSQWAMHSTRANSKTDTRKQLK